MSDPNTAYYRQRATAERAQALKTERQDIAEIHAELARLYQALVDQAELRPMSHMLIDDGERRLG